MLLPQIMCYHAEASMLPFTFYILSKGDNAGKPAFTPWTNSFALVCTNKEHFDFYFWLCYGLFKAGKFKIYHRGSVIAFINKADVRELLREAAPFVHDHYQQYQKIMQALNHLEEKRASLTEQIIATEKLQSYLIRPVSPNKKTVLQKLLPSTCLQPANAFAKNF